MLGVHSPEFAFEKDTENVRAAVKKFDIQYPVALDSDIAIWKAFNNKFWPAHYFVDAKGQIRGHHFGEGKYARSEREIRRLLTEAGAKNLPEPLDDAAGGCRAPADIASVGSPETYFGYARAENFVSPGAFARDAQEELRGSQGALAQPMGVGWRWQWRARHARLDGAPGRIAFRFKARDLHLVLGPARRGQTGALSRHCSVAHRRRRMRAWTWMRTAMAWCASTGFTSSSARRSGEGAGVRHRVPRPGRRRLLIHIRLKRGRFMGEAMKSRRGFLLGALLSPRRSPSEPARAQPINRSRRTSDRKLFRRGQEPGKGHRCAPGQDGRGVAQTIFARLLCRHSQGRHGTAVHWQIQRESRGRSLSLHLLRIRVVRLDDQIRVRHGLAEFLEADLERQCTETIDYSAAHEPPRRTASSAMRTSGTCSTTGRTPPGCVIA